MGPLLLKIFNTIGVGACWRDEDLMRMSLSPHWLDVQWILTVSLLSYRNFRAIALKCTGWKENGLKMVVQNGGGLEGQHFFSCTTNWKFRHSVIPQGREAKISGSLGNKF